MIVPSTRLIWLTAAAGFPLAVAAALAPSTRSTAAICGAALVASILVDSFLRSRALRGADDLKALRRGSEGMRALRQIGRGREFEKLREYVPGDGFDEIHWKATARHGHPITKVFQVERTQEVYVVIDSSRLAGRFTK